MYNTRKFKIVSTGSSLVWVTLKTRIVFNYQLCPCYDFYFFPVPLKWFFFIKRSLQICWISNFLILMDLPSIFNLVNIAKSLWIEIWIEIINKRKKITVSIPLCHINIRETSITVYRVPRPRTPMILWSLLPCTVNFSRVGSFLSVSASVFCAALICTC